MKERDELIDKCKRFKGTIDQLREKLAEKSPPAAVNQKVDEKLAKELEEANKKIRHL